MQRSEQPKWNLKRNGKKKKKFKIQAVSGDWLSEESTSEDDFKPVFRLNRKDGSIRVVINGQNVKMVVDTGSKQNIISSRLYRALFQSYELQKTNKMFTAYGQQKPLKCLGYFHATLRSGIHCIDSKVYVIDGEAESLLGRESSFNFTVYVQNLDASIVFATLFRILKIDGKMHFQRVYF